MATMQTGGMRRINPNAEFEEEPKASPIQIAATVVPQAMNALKFINNRAEGLLNESGYLNKTITVPDGDGSKVIDIFERKPGKGPFRNPTDRIGLTDEAFEHFRGQENPFGAFKEKAGGFFDDESLWRKAYSGVPKNFLPSSALNFAPKPFTGLQAMKANPIGISFNPAQTGVGGVGFNPSSWKAANLASVKAGGLGSAGATAGAGAAGAGGGGFFSNLASMTGPGGILASMALSMLGKKLFKEHTLLGKIFRLFG